MRAVSSQFQPMSRHDEAVRTGTPGGTVIFSRLPAGRSRIAAHPPSLKFVLQGEETYVIAGRTRRVGPGEFILVEGHTDFEVRTSSRDESIGLCIYLGIAAPQERTTSELAAPVIGGSRLDPLSAMLSSYAGAMVRDLHAGAGLANRLVRQAAAGSEDFLTRFARAQRKLTQARPATRTEILQRLERARSFIHDQAGRLLTLDEIARVAALSRYHLIHAFGEAYGVSPLAYHRSLRLRAAAVKLRLGAASPSELADQLGYASPSAFTRAFKAEFGEPPSRFAARQ